MRHDRIVVQVDHTYYVTGGGRVPDQSVTSRVAAKLAAGCIEEKTGNW